MHSSPRLRPLSESDSQWTQLLLQDSQLTLLDVNNGLGTFLGVVVPTLSTMFGVVIFLRMGEIVGLAGLSGALVLCEQA